MFDSLWAVFFDWREESIKTRIETGRFSFNPVKIYPIEEKNPLKQGLKLHKSPNAPAIIGIEEKNPLKQGLKLEIKEPTGVQLRIEEKNPLKQGLKRLTFNFLIWSSVYWREESIKTRIETSSIFYRLLFHFWLKRRIH